MAAHRRLALAFLFALSLTAEEKRAVVRAGPFRVVSLTGLAPAQLALAELEQFRFTFSLFTGHKDPALVWPVTLVVFKPSRNSPPEDSSLTLARDARFASLRERSPLPPALLENLAVLFVEDNLKRLPPPEERGLLATLTQFSSEGTHITIGVPPASARTLDWARIHRFAADPASIGELHVFLSNLESGAGIDVACRNAFRQSSSAMEASLDAYFKAGSFSEAAISGLAIAPNRDFHGQTLDADEEKLALADLALATKNTAAAKSGYSALHGSESEEGLGLIALSEGDKDAARAHLQSAARLNSKSAHAYAALAGLESDTKKKRMDLQQAAALNPRWAEPLQQLSLTEVNPAGAVIWLKKAVALAPRNLAYWRALAESATAAQDFPTAEKAWTGAAIAAQSGAERQQLIALRRSLEVQRADAVEADRKRELDARAQDLERVKNLTLASIHAAEAKANKALNSDGAAPVVNAVPYASLDGEHGPKAEGTLVRLECRGAIALLVLEDANHHLSKFLVRDPTHLAVTGAATSIGCGQQNPPRKAIVEYLPKTDRRYSTAGEAQAVDFP